MAKKFLVVLLALCVVFAMAGCGDKDPVDPGDEDGSGGTEDVGNLGLPTYNKGDDDSAGAESQAAWKVEDEAKYAVLAASGTKLVVTFENAIAGGMQIIWQAHDGTTYGGWNQENAASDAGAGISGKTTVSDDKKTITITLSATLKDYNTASTGFLAKTGDNKKAQIILAYYTGTNKMKGLKVKKADLVAATP